MDNEKALLLIKECVTIVNPASADLVTEESKLIEDGILDSLDAMSFVFNIERRLGSRLKCISEEETTFAVRNILDEIAQNQLLD